MILIYTGSGKGKTCACIGQAIRALGHGMTVAFGQFIKKSDVAGEQKMLASLPGCIFRAGGIGFCFSDADMEPHREKAHELLEWAREVDCQMLVLDEALYAAAANLVEISSLASLNVNSDGSPRHLVLSGRYADLPALQFADIITEMKEIKHPYRFGAPPERGIEF